jgi:hypothetical protein
VSVAAVAVILAALVVLLLRTRQLRAGSCMVCVLLGLVIGATPAGPAVNEGLTAAGTWLWEQVSSL